MQVACEGYPRLGRIKIGPKDAALRQARICYDHLAGRLGVEVTDAMVSAGYAELSPEGGFLTNKGTRFLERMGIEASGFTTTRGKDSKRGLCRPCLDWSERRLHLGGAIGAAICRHSLARDWIRRKIGTRAVAVTPLGQQVYRDQFGIIVADIS